MIVVGIDLGVTGAATRIDHHGAVEIADLPITEDFTGKRLDARAFWALMRRWVPASEAGQVITEDVRVQTMPGRPMSHSTEGVIVGLRYSVHTALDLMGLPVRFVSPQAWKRHYAIVKDTTGKQARDMAAGMFPSVAGQLARVKDHNRAESVLIAHFGRSTLA